MKPSLKIVIAVCISNCKDTTKKDKTPVITHSGYLTVKRLQHETFWKTGNEPFFFLFVMYITVSTPFMTTGFSTEKTKH